MEYNDLYDEFMMQEQIPLVEPGIKGRLELAKCFRALARFGDSAGECEIRNALSRSYYAVFHASVAFLMAKNEPGSKGNINHEQLQGKIGVILGKGAKSTLQALLSDRTQADYDWNYLDRKFQGSVETFRAQAALRLEVHSAEYEAYLERIWKIDEEKGQARQEEASQ